MTGLLRDMGFSVQMADPSKNPVMHKGLEETVKLFIRKRDLKKTG